MDSTKSPGVAGPSVADQDAERPTGNWKRSLEPADRGEEYDGQTNPVGLLAILGLFVLLYMWAGPRYFLVVLGIVVMIFLHEVGHFATAKWTGMKVTQFFMFMGPRLWSFRRGETEYGVRLLPIGAFVRIVGMNNLDPCTPEDEPRAYKNKSYPKRMLVITAGSMMHFLQAILLFGFVMTVIGLNDPSKWSVGLISQLEDQSTPSIEAGLEPGDDIVAIDGVDTTDWGETVEYISSRPGEVVTLTVERGGEVFDKTVTLASIPDQEGDGQRGFLGVGPSFERTRESPMLAVETFGETMRQAVTAIPRFLAPSTLGELGRLMFEGSGSVDINSEEAERPVSLVGAVRIAGQQDFDVTVPLMMLGIFNIFVGVLNLLPLLPLDGGHAAIATYERLRSRGDYRHQVDVAKLLPVAYAVIGLLGFIMISTVYLDIVRPIG